MPEILLDLDRGYRWLDWFRAGGFRESIQQGCRVSLTRPGHSSASFLIRPAKGTAEDLATLVEELRRNPALSLTPQGDAALRELAGRWFSALGGTGEIGPDDELHLCGSAETEPWFSGIPWELAGIRAIPSISGRLAGMPFTRRLRGSQAYRPAPGPRLRILTCVALDGSGREAGDIDTSLFMEEMRGTLRDRTASMEWRNVTEDESETRYSHLEATMTDWRPHVVVLVCHGRLHGGEPELLFEEWKRVASLADALASDRQAMTVVLLACDQAVLARTREHRSGAVVLLSAGVPSVVAMQNKIRGDCAAWFLGGFLDGLLQDGRVTQAAKLGRRQIASHLPADDLARVLDWAFPALFLNDEGAAALQLLTDRPKDIVRQLDATMRKIPRAAFDFTRLADSWNWDQAGHLLHRAGLFTVTGAPGIGKTHWIRKQCRTHIDRQIDRSTTDTRRVLYVDFERAEGVGQGLVGLYEAICRQAAECSPAGVTWEPWYWTKLASDQPGLNLAEIIDANRMVLVLDSPGNFIDDLPAGWEQVFHGLAKSLVLIIGGTAPPGAAEYPLVALTRAEVEDYWVARGGPAAAGNEIWLHTGGVIRILDHYWYSVQPNGAMEPNNNAYLAWVLAGLTPEQRKLLFVLSRIPEGVNVALVHARIAQPEDVRALERKGVLLHEYRKECPSPFVRLATALIDALEETQSVEADEADSHLVNSIQASLARWPGNETEQLVALARAPGGLDLILAVQRAWARQGIFAPLASLAAGLEPFLTSRGNWLAVFRLWRNAALVAEEFPLTADQLVSYGWSRLYTGEADGAKECLMQADALAEPDQRSGRHRLLQAAWLKQTGQREQEAAILEIYAGLIAAGEGPGQISSEGHKDAAMARYNRSLIQRHWRGDLVAALADLAVARSAFEQLGLFAQAALAQCEEVEVRLHSPANTADFATMLRDLTRAAQKLAVTEDYGGQAFAAYQLARLYRQQAASVQGADRQQLLVKAHEAYGEARDIASGHELVVESCAAEIHVVEIGLTLEKVSLPTADEKLAQVITWLRLARGDAWAQRLQRDAWILRARVARTPAGAITAWRQALGCATTAPCHPDFGTDRHRAAHALRELAGLLVETSQDVELDQLFVARQELIEQLIGQAFVFTGANHQDWIAALPH
jgi:hypothetical protein